jgi:hypothetical protein
VIRRRSPGEAQRPTFRRPLGRHFGGAGAEPPRIIILIKSRLTGRRPSIDRHGFSVDRHGFSFVDVQRIDVFPCISKDDVDLAIVFCNLYGVACLLFRYRVFVLIVTPK